MKNVILFIFCFLWSCNNINTNIYDDSIDDYETYTIKKGNHSSGNHLMLKLTKKIEFFAIFTESCVYNLNSKDQSDTNKLFGISDSYSHSEDSARFGWRYFNDRLEILSYVRKSGVFYYETIGFVEPNEIVYYSLEILNDRYKFTLRDKIYFVERTSDYNGIRYGLFPYFGGNNVAPHNIEIKIKLL